MNKRIFTSKDKWTWALAYKLSFENFLLNFHNSWSLLCPYFEISSCTSFHAFLELCILSFHSCCYYYCCFVVDIFTLVLMFYFTFFWVIIMQPLDNIEVLFFLHMLAHTTWDYLRFLCPPQAIIASTVLTNKSQNPSPSFKLKFIH